MLCDGKFMYQSLNRLLSWLLIRLLRGQYLMTEYTIRIQFFIVCKFS